MDKLINTLEHIIIRAEYLQKEATFDAEKVGQIKYMASKAKSDVLAYRNNFH